MTEPVAEFVSALREADAALAGVRDRLAGTRLPDAAFGKLFEAGEVREVYDARLPAVELDLEEARAVLGHFVAGLTGGHPIVDVS
ncbi:MAG: hypothetical protein AUG44_09525 [Actinobacteria bacterium 13_1_20CM_3_71_11]|nr:MAG: hypothetical protein AUG44_09525 [Actinobacteria bacterium 13_1_20CM_3_71_11]